MPGVSSGDFNLGPRIEVSLAPQFEHFLRFSGLPFHFVDRFSAANIFYTGPIISRLRMGRGGCAGGQEQNLGGQDLHYGWAGVIMHNSQ